MWNRKTESYLKDIDEIIKHLKEKGAAVKKTQSKIYVDSST